MIDNEKPPETAPGTAEEETPEVYAVKKGKDGFALSRRSFLGVVAAAGALAASASGLGSKASANPAESGPLAADCGAMRAFEGPVWWLLTIDETLFSWNEYDLKAWSWKKGALIGSATRDPDGFFKIAESAASFPLLLGRIDATSSPRVFAANGKTLMRIHAVGDEVEIWSTEDGETAKMQTLAMPGYMVESVALSADGKTLAVRTARGSIDITNVGEKEPLRTLWTEETVRSMAFLSDKSLLLCGTALGTLRVWSLKDEKVVNTIKLGEKGSVSILAVTKGDDLAAVGYGDDLLLLSLPEGQAANKISLNGEYIRAVSVSSDGQRLATGTNRGNLYLWDLKTAVLIGCLFDPDLTEQGAEVSQARLMGPERVTAPCDEPLPSGATCLCDCVAADRTYERAAAVCVCDTISRPAGYGGENIVCVCHTVKVGSKQSGQAPKNPCGCVGNVSSSGGHYWHPN